MYVLYNINWEHSVTLFHSILEILLTAVAQPPGGTGGTCPTQLFLRVGFVPPNNFDPNVLSSGAFTTSYLDICRPLKSRLHSDDGDPCYHQLGLVNQQMPPHQSLHVKVRRVSSTTDKLFQIRGEFM